MFGLNQIGQFIKLDVNQLMDGASTQQAMAEPIDMHDTRGWTHAMSADGTMVGSSAATSPAGVWDIETGTLLAEFGDDRGQTAIAFHPTKPWAYVSEHGLITVHTLDVEELIEIARASVTRELTTAKCQRFRLGNCPESHR